MRREVRRGKRYDGIILDPPKYGRGPEGEVWELYAGLPELITTNLAAYEATALRFARDPARRVVDRSGRGRPGVVGPPRGDGLQPHALRR